MKKHDLGQDVNAMKEGEDTIDNMNQGVQEMIVSSKSWNKAVGFTAKLGVVLVPKQLVDTAKIINTIC